MFDGVFVREEKLQINVLNFCFSVARLKCIQFTVPSDEPLGIHTLNVVGDNQGSVVFDRDLSFNVVDSSSTFVQTDKPAYKPGQTVQFRLLTVDVDLNPSTSIFSKIYIKDPDNVIMKQWLNESSPSGLISLEFGISKEPVLGMWSIESELEGQIKKTPFEIKEYVLPKFEVTLSVPNYITIESETINGEVCAIYTYGQPVKGRLKVSICLKGSEDSRFSQPRPCLYFQGEIEGCHKFSLNTSHLELKNEKFTIQNQVLNTTASVLDNATGILIHETSSKTSLSMMDLFLDMKTYSEPFYKPGLPYLVKVRATNLKGLPVSGAKLGLRAEELSLTREIVTNEQGYGMYLFPAMTSNQTIIVFKIVSLDAKYREEINEEHTLSMPGASIVVEPWYSPTRSFLKITPMTDKAACLSTISLEVSVTQAPEKQFRLYLMMVSRGKIVMTREKSVAKRDRVEDGCQDGFQLHDCIYRKQAVARRFGDVRVEMFLIDVNITEAMWPGLQVILYYVKDFGEVVSDYVDIKISPCERNLVEMEFGTEEEYPGYETSLTLQAAPGSICGLAVIDKSITLLGNTNDITQSQLLKSSEIFNVDLHDPPDPVYSHDKVHCKKWLETHEPPRRLITSWNDKTDPNIIKRDNIEKVSIIASGFYPDDEDSFYYRVEHADSILAFKAAGLVVVTDLELETRPCEEVWKKPYLQNDEFSGADEEYEIPKLSTTKKEKKKQIAVRDYFPETWLWDIEIVGESGELVLKKKLPHTITKWIGSAICSSKDNGIGISNEATITTFQPFFTSFNLPYSAIRGEFIPIKVTTFNYLSECVQIRLELKESEFIDIDPDVGAVTWLCICSSEAKSHDFIVVAKKIGSINLTIVAEAVNGDEKCSGIEISEDAVGVQDTVIRTLLVEPEGTEKEYTYSSLVCPEESPNGQYRSLVDMPIPKDHVRDSARGFVSLIGDLMGPSLNSATDLLKKPYGCGEQNMINFAPNVFIMTYTKASGQMDSLDKRAMERFIVDGYQRELRYRHGDGSYSAFGESDDSGSTWLTAFVAKCFHKAADFVYIDKAITDSAFRWLRNHRVIDGCITSRGRVLHTEMKGGIAGSDGLLSAYVYTAMLESSVLPTDGFILRGATCFKNRPPNSSYALAMYTYFAALYKPGFTWHKELVKKLEAAAIKRDNMMYWTKDSVTDENNLKTTIPYRRPNAQDIETTAYALLAYQADPVPKYTKMIKIVRWLTEQQNSNGGFISTQDTIVALQALSGYAALMFKGSPSQNVFIDTFDYAKTFDINQTNALVQLTTPIIAFPTSITVMAKGKGCSVLQATVRYNMIEEREPVEPFYLNVEVQSPIFKPNVCKRRGLKICSSYLGERNASNMAVIVVKMPTGWTADMYTVNKVCTVFQCCMDASSLWHLRLDYSEHFDGNPFPLQLQQSTVLFLKRFEIDDNRPDVLNFYFDEINHDKVCFEFDMVQELEVKNLKPAYVSVYDYYEPDLIVQDFYEFGPDCNATTRKQPPKATKDQPVDNRSPEEIEFETIPKNMLYVRNLIDNSLLPLSTTLSPEVTTAAPVKGKCPVCKDLSLKELISRICKSAVAYSSMVLKGNKLRLMRDFMPNKKTIINLSTRFKIHAGCHCYLRDIRKKSKVLILLENDQMADIQKKKILKLDDKSTVIVLSRTVKKAIIAAKRSRYCKNPKAGVKKSKVTQETRSVSKEKAKL
ncbi:hypothetical protein LOTGIDRAFT_227923 [Lottia gigantea]|uniref:NTR domain-containing protein n=1 Tax=Lottia gigantea TaxID=225164 RepID=V4BC80_LOTGI|nr:hypothetical protein LOTGIDRAFT_227923 [Lottia gigantea]ESP05271.1 hypothetical protein LOTGIDRAFT_227923 [Lottia gigantea]